MRPRKSTRKAMDASSRPHRKSVKRRKPMVIDYERTYRKEDFHLSRHFTFFEMTRTYLDELQEKNRTVSEHDIYKLAYLCHNILEPIRENVKLPFIISSGYRCKEVNEAVKGALTSQHLYCEACDFQVKGLDDLELLAGVFDWTRNNKKIPFGQLILEVSGPKDRSKAWIHISSGEPFRLAYHCRQVGKFFHGSEIWLPYIPSY